MHMHVCMCVPRRGGPVHVHVHVHVHAHVHVPVRPLSRGEAARIREAVAVSLRPFASRRISQLAIDSILEESRSKQEVGSSKW